MRSATQRVTEHPNYYKRLQVATDASSVEIKASYRKHALECHPDVVKDSARAAAEVRFRAMSEAYENLIDPTRRRIHDERLGIQSVAGSPMQPPSAVAKRRPQRSQTYTPYSATAVGRNAAAQQAGKASAAEGQKWRKSFLRGDADRAFADAFDGRSVDQILFDAHRRQRQAAAAQKHHEGPQAAAGRVESLRRVLEHNAQMAADRATVQYGGPSALKHLRTTPLRRGPAAAPSDYMPFRPFVNMPVPEGVRTPPTPSMGPVVSSDNEKKVEVVEATYTPAKKRAEDRVNPANFLDSDTPAEQLRSRSQSLDRAERNIQGAAYNMGQLYSYNRPY